MTTLIPILFTFLFEDFSKASGFKGQGPKTLRERLTLTSVYAPYLLIPLMLLLLMLRSPYYYRYEEKRKKKWERTAGPVKRCPQGSFLLDPVQGKLLRTHVFSSIWNTQQQEPHQNFPFQGHWHRPITWGWTKFNMCPSSIAELLKTRPDQKLDQLLRNILLGIFVHFIHNIHVTNPLTQDSLQQITVQQNE